MAVKLAATKEHRIPPQLISGRVISAKRLCADENVKQIEPRMGEISLMVRRAQLSTRDEIKPDTRCDAPQAAVATGDRVTLSWVKSMGVN